MRHRVNWLLVLFMLTRAASFDCRTLTADGLPTTSVLFIEPDDHFLASGWISGNKESTPIPVDFWDSTAQQACVSINNKLLSLGALMRYFVTPSAAALKTPSIQTVHDLLRPDLTPIEHRIVTIRARSAVGYWAHKHLRFSHIDVFTADFSAAPAPCVFLLPLVSAARVFKGFAVAPVMVTLTTWITPRRATRTPFSSIVLSPGNPDARPPQRHSPDTEVTATR